MTNTITAYKLYNFRGRRVVFSLYPIHGEIMDEIKIELPEGFQLKDDCYGIPAIYAANFSPVTLITTRRGAPALLEQTGPRLTYRYRLLKVIEK